jgi:hypothetical protein
MCCVYDGIEPYNHKKKMSFKCKVCLLQCEHADGQRCYARVPRCSGGPSGGPQVPGHRGGRFSVCACQGWHGSCSRRVSDGLPQLPQVDGECWLRKCRNPTDVSEVRTASIRAATHCPDGRVSTHLWNVGKHVFDYTAVHPRRLSTSYSPPWEPEI